VQGVQEGKIFGECKKGEAGFVVKRQGNVEGGETTTAVKMIQTKKTESIFIDQEKGQERNPKRGQRKWKGE